MWLRLCLFVASAVYVCEAVQFRGEQRTRVLPVVPVFIDLHSSNDPATAKKTQQLPDTAAGDVIHDVPRGQNADTNTINRMVVPKYMTKQDYTSTHTARKGPVPQPPEDVNPSLPPAAPGADRQLDGLNPEFLYNHFGPAPLDQPFGPVFHTFSSPHDPLLTGQPGFRPRVVPTDVSTGVKLGPRESMFYNDPYRVQRMEWNGAMVMPKGLLNQDYLPLYPRPDLQAFLKQEFKATATAK